MKTMIIAACLGAFTMLNARDFVWANALGAGSNDLGRCITVNTFGEVYTTGYFRGTVDFDPGPGTALLTASGGSDIFILKMDASGSFLWAQAFGGAADDFGRNITLDASGDVYTIGHFRGTADFDPGVGTANLTANGGSDIFIQKMHASGVFEWAKAFGGFWDDGGRSISIDAAGNIYTTGHFHGTVDFDPGAGIFNQTSSGGRDIFILKMDPLGDLDWVKTFVSNLADNGNSIMVDTSGNVYTAGIFRGTVDFDPGAGTTNLSAVGSQDIFIQKMDTSGNMVWAKSIGGTLNELARSIAVDDSGNVYTTGAFQGTVDFDPGAGTANLSAVGGYDVFIQKMDASGNFLWAKTFGSPSPDSGISTTVDSAGNVYTTGFFQGVVDFGLESYKVWLTINNENLDTNHLWVEALAIPTSPFSIL